MRMKRIHSTSVGSLQCPDEELHREAVRLIVARQGGEEVDEGRYEAVIGQAMALIVKRQIEIGIDGISNGGYDQTSFMDYMADGRIKGIRRSGKGRGWLPRDLVEHPNPTVQHIGMPHFAGIELTGPLSYADTGLLEREIERFKAALAPHARESYTYAFLCSSSPGMLADQLWNWSGPNPGYESYRALLEDCAEVMRLEYLAKYQAGFHVQVDAPELLMLGQNFPLPDALQEYRQQLLERIAVMQAALRDIPAERIRVHACSGNWVGSHEYDVRLGTVLDLLVQLPGALSIEGANPTHEDEWEDLRAVQWPAGKPLLWGVIDSKNVQYETPRLVAQRLVRVAEIIGPDNVWACTDCGLHTFLGRDYIRVEMSWEKLRRMVQGAKLASQRLV
jgi:5-methyltetrahydropteroyltriglutamate--homocysteine methyltransferase